MSDWAINLNSGVNLMVSLNIQRESASSLLFIFAKLPKFSI